MSSDPDWHSLPKIDRWYKYIGPSMAAGIAAGFMAFLFEFTRSNLILLASVCATAGILAYRKRAHVAKLKTVMTAYTLVGLASIITVYITTHFPLEFHWKILILVTLITLFLYSFNVLHPPAISAGVAFVIAERPLPELILLIVAIFTLFITLRLVVYGLSKQLELREFIYEFVHEEYEKAVCIVEKKKKRRRH